MREYSTPEDPRMPEPHPSRLQLYSNAYREYMKIENTTAWKAARVYDGIYHATEWNQLFYSHPLVMEIEMNNLALLERYEEAAIVELAIEVQEERMIAWEQGREVPPIPDLKEAIKKRQEQKR